MSRWAWTIGLACGLLIAPSARGGGLLYVDDSAPGTGDGSSWDGALNSLQAALAVASDPQNGVCEIRIAQGVYQPTARIDPDDPRSVTFAMLDGVALRGGYAGVGAPDPNVRDIELYPTILSGDLNGNDGAAGTFLNYEENAYHVVLSLGTSATALLDGVTITAGSGCCGLGQIDPRGYGGGVFHDGAAQFIDCTFTLNQAATRGGGFYNAGGAPVFVRCSFTRNRATDAYADGGGLYCQHGQVLLAFCTFDWNEAQAGGGFFATGATVNLVECVFEHNRAFTTAGKGGAGWLGGCELIADGCTFQHNEAGLSEGALSSVESSVTLTNCAFIENSADDFTGAVSSDNYLKLQDCQFIGNSTDTYYGGAISGWGQIEIRGCEFHDNSAGTGGGALDLSGLSPPAIVADCIFTSNSAGFDGGAMYTSAGDVHIARCQFVGNGAQDGGALRAGGWTMTVTDSQFVSNFAADNGGAIRNTAALSLVNCEFRANRAYSSGGAILAAQGFHATNCLFAGNRIIPADSGSGGALNVAAASEVVNCTFTENLAHSSGAVHVGAAFTARNCIFWANQPDQIVPMAQATVHFSNIEGGWPGQGAGNINAPPGFTNPTAGDYRLAAASPCIDAGSSLLWPPGFMLDLANQMRFMDDPRTPDTGEGGPPMIDMGAYEYQAASTLCVADCALPHDGMVNVNDLLAVIAAWGMAGVHPTNLNGDGVVDVNDLLLVIDAWGPCPA